MKVLWFTNTPALASNKLGVNTNTGGWISSLERHLSSRKDIELGIAFPFGHDKLNIFTIDRTSYFAIPSPKHKQGIRGILRRWCHPIEKEDELLFYSSIIKQFNPDVIHIFGSERSFGLILNECTIPVVIQIQGNLTLCTLKWFSGLSFLQVLKYSDKKKLLFGFNTFHDYYLTKKRAIREQKILAQCKYIIGRTSWDRRINKILAPKSAYFHCNEILRDIFYTKQWHFHDSKEILLFSTLNSTIYKGLEVLLKAAHLLTMNGTVKFKWLVGGLTGHEEIVTIIEKSHDLNFASVGVIFKGALCDAELVNYLIQATCYVHPSHIENSPNSVCEAMILGVPTIATYAGGTPSILIDGLEGIMVQDGDHYALAGAILELTESPKMMQQFSKNARRKALMRHEPSTILQDLLDIYRKMLQGS
jgi:glycosyltransferase involved in cell wall biosynthesis